MKVTLIAASLLLAVSATQAQTIKPEQAKDHIGDSVKVCGKVFQVYQAKNSNGQPTYINFGAPYPQSVFTE